MTSGDARCGESSDETKSVLVVDDNGGESQGTSPDDSTSSEASKPLLSVRTLLAVLAVCFIYFAQLVSLVGAGAQGQTIAGHFHDTQRVSWFSAPITILTVVLGPIVSQAADYWGRKPFLVLLTLLGAVGSVIVARATSMGMAIAGFCVIGTSFGVQPLLHTVTSEVLPRRWRAHGQAANMVSNGLGSITGLLVGGALNRTGDPSGNGFRYYFYMGTGWYFLAAMLCAVAYNPPATDRQREFRGRPRSTRERLRKLDWVGYFLLAAGLVLFCVGLSWSQAPYPWSDPHVSATFAVGLALVLALVVYETWFKRDGMFHHGLFTRNRNFPIVLFCVFAEGVAFFAANTYYVFQVSVLYEEDALLVGSRYCIMLISSMLGAALTGVYCAITRKVRWVTVLAFAIFVAFFVCMATTNRHTNTPVWVYPVLLGSALGMTLTALITVGQLSTPPELIAVASGLIIGVRSLGGSVGIAIYNALFQDQMKHLSGSIAQAVRGAGLNIHKGSIPDLVTSLREHDSTDALGGTIPGVTAEVIRTGRIALQETHVLAFRHIWIAGGCFVALATVVSTFLFDPEWEFNMDVDASVEKGKSRSNEA